MRYAGTLADAQAQARALDLLRLLFGDVVAHDALECGEIAVPSPRYPGRIYRISIGGFVRVERAGRYLAHLCIQPSADLPWADVFLTHALLIEGDEVHYLRTANIVGSALFLGAEDADLLPRWCMV